MLGEPLVGDAAIDERAHERVAVALVVVLDHVGVLERRFGPVGGPAGVVPRLHRPGGELGPDVDVALELFVEGRLLVHRQPRHAAELDLDVVGEVDPLGRKRVVHVRQVEHHHVGVALLHLLRQVADEQAHELRRRGEPALLRLEQLLRVFALGVNAHVRRADGDRPATDEAGLHLELAGLAVFPLGGLVELDVFEEGFEHAGVCVVEHAEVPRAVGALGEDLGAILGVEALPLTGAGLVDGELNRPGVAPAETVVELVHAQRAVRRAVVERRPALALAIHGGVLVMHGIDREGVGFLHGAAVMIQRPPPPHADLPLEEVGDRPRVGVVVCAPHFFAAADEEDAVRRGPDDEALDGDVRCVDPRAPRAGTVADDDRRRVRIGLAAHDLERRPGGGGDGVLQFTEQLVGEAARLGGVDHAAGFAVLDEDDRIVLGRVVHRDGIEVGRAEALGFRLRGGGEGEEQAHRREEKHRVKRAGQSHVVYSKG